MKEHYCPHCHISYKAEVCPQCGSRGRLSTAEDLIFYMDSDYLLTPRIEDFLEAQNIPYIKKGELGAGLTTRLGFSFEHNYFFIPLKAYKDFERELEEFKETIKSQD